MLLIVGLGNPGKKYEKTRHNVGFTVLDRFAKEVKTGFKPSTKFESEIAEATLTFPGEKKHVKVLLAKPQTYMNESGKAVAKLVNFYKFRTSDQVWIVHDDLDIDLGKIRIRLNGSSAGQKGIQSIIESLGTDQFVRFRVGIKPDGGQNKPAEEFVLENFKTDELETVEEEIEEAVRELIESCNRGIIQNSI